MLIRVILILCSWWSIKRVQRRHAERDFEYDSSLGQYSSQGLSATSRSSRRYRGGPTWQDPWLPPPPKPSRTPAPAHLEVVVGGTKGKGVAHMKDDGCSDASSMPLEVYKNTADDGKAVS